MEGEKRDMLGSREMLLLGCEDAGNQSRIFGVRRQVVAGYDTVVALPCRAYDTRWSSPSPVVALDIPMYHR